MSVNQVGLIGPRAEPQKQEKPKKDIWDEIMRGLQIAGGITGIYSDVTNIQKNRTAQAEVDRQLKGERTPGEQLDDQAKGLNFSNTLLPGATEITDTATGQKKYGLLPPKAEKAPPSISPGEQARLDLANKQFEFQKSQAGIKNAAAAATAENPKVKPPTEAQVSSATFGRKAEAANTKVQELEESGYNPASYKRAARGILPLGVTKTTEDRQYEQAQKEFIAAILRKESGGAITPDEFTEYGKIYFPSPGDDADVIAQKADSRTRAYQGLLEGAGEGATNQITNKTKPGQGPAPVPGTALGATDKDTSNIPPVDAVEAEMKKRGLKPKSQGATGGY